MAERVETELQAVTELRSLIDHFHEKIEQRARVIDTGLLIGNYREIYQSGMTDAFALMKPLLEAALKTSDHRLIGHSEPDAYTKLGCLTNVATEAVETFRKDLAAQYNEDLNRVRRIEQTERKEDMKEPWGAQNPASTRAEADHRAREWVQQGICIDVGLHEVLGWTPYEVEKFHTEGIVPTGYEHSVKV